MAKRELSSTLRNLKFMQRVAQKEENAKKEEEQQEVIPNGNFPSRIGPQKCVVIMEGDPHPGAMRGRMSFQSFNPAIDKLNGEVSISPQSEASTTSTVRDSEMKTERGDGSPQVGLENLQQLHNSGSGSNGDHKRKTPNVYEASYPRKSQKSLEGDQVSSPRRSHTPGTQPKREELDFNVLVRRSKPGSKR